MVFVLLTTLTARIFIYSRWEPESIQGQTNKTKRKLHYGVLNYLVLKYYTILAFLFLCFGSGTKLVFKCLFNYYLSICFGREINTIFSIQTWENQPHVRYPAELHDGERKGTTGLRQGSFLFPPFQRLTLELKLKQT